MTCPGNTFEYCGAGNRLEMYQLWSNVTLSTSTTTTTATTSASAKPTPSHVQVVGPYTFQGCYTEATGMRALTGPPSLVNYTAMTIEMCESHCAQYNSIYFGVEYAGECKQRIALILCI